MFARLSRGLPHFIDEPTNGLDEAGVWEIRQVIAQEKERGALILLASHNRDDMKILAHKVYKVADGCIGEEADV